MDKNLLTQLTERRHELASIMLSYKFAIQTLETKLEIISEEFKTLHHHNPIEHIKSRIKNPERIFKKVMKHGYDLSLDSIRENVRDIAGIRIICSFVKDIYELVNMLKRQTDLRIVEVKDYIKKPKASGYQSLHIIVQIPIHMVEKTEWVYVEIQIRTIAMDFWASLEHKINYKYEDDIPEHIQRKLRETARQVALMDQEMAALNAEVSDLKLDEGKSQLISDEQWDTMMNYMRQALESIE